MEKKSKITEWTEDGIKDANFEAKTFKKLLAKNQRIENVTFKDCYFEACNFQETEFINVKFNHCVFEQVSFCQSTFDRSQFLRGVATESDFSETKWRRSFMNSMGLWSSFIDNIDTKRLWSVQFHNMNFEQTNIHPKYLLDSIFLNCTGVISLCLGRDRCLLKYCPVEKDVLIQIGCTCLSYDKWLLEHKKLAKLFNYTPEDVSFYKEMITLAYYRLCQQMEEETK